MSQKRVAVVLASLVGVMTIGAGTLMLLEGGALGTNVPAMALAPQLQPPAPLQLHQWNYIIIYESADVAASADSLSDGMLSGGNSPSTMTHNLASPPLAPPRPKAYFHFVIDSAQTGNGLLDGELQVGASWKEQETGAPYAGWPDSRTYLYTPYTNAIGICLVADINRKPLSDAQHKSLLHLVQQLQQRFNIHKEEVLFQWDRRLNAHPASRAQQAYDQLFHTQLD